MHKNNICISLAKFKWIFVIKWNITIKKNVSWCIDVAVFFMLLFSFIGIYRCSDSTFFPVQTSFPGPDQWCSTRDVTWDLLHQPRVITFPLHLYFSATGFPLNHVGFINFILFVLNIILQQYLDCSFFSEALEERGW